MTRLWRIPNLADLTGTGGLHFEGRWHSLGQRIVYTAAHPAGAVTELLVSNKRGSLPLYFQMLEIALAPSLAIEEIPLASLPPGWTGDKTITRAIGDGWLSECRTLALRVPSVLVPNSWNVLLNPAHSDASALRIVSVSQYPLDDRFR